FVTPSDPKSALWTQELANTFALPWSIGQGPVDHKETPLKLKVDAPVVGEMRRLSAELSDLLGPIEVNKRLPLDPASLGSGTDVLLSGEGGQPILVGATPPGGTS